MRSDRPPPIDRATVLAFAGRLRASARSLDRSRTSTVEARWLRAYLLAATGELGRAERAARRVLAETNDPAIEARAAATLGSILRQTGRHAQARTIESSALRRATSRELRAHLLIGLAADSVGLGDLAAVDRALRRAVAERARGWRVAVRLRWVRCERELLAGHPAAAARWARSALAAAEKTGARRHIAKSLLFLGAASRAISLSDGGVRARLARLEAGRSLRRARSIASRIGARPIERVAGELLGSMGKHR
ncbi:MAG: hypothetical protein WEB06_03885 [Actinomycetota bacterium]